MWIKANAGSNQGANGVQTFNFDNVLGLIVLRFVLLLGGTFTKSQITNIKLKANGGKLVFDDSGSRANERMVYRGHTAAAAYLSLDFTERKSKTIVGQMLGALDTVASGFTALTGEFTIAGATSPTLDIWAECIKASDSPAALLDGQERIAYQRSMSKVLTSVQNFPSTAADQLLVLPSLAQPGARAKRTFLYGNVASLTVKRNGVNVMDRVTSGLQGFDLGEAGKTIPGSCFVIDWLKENNQSDAFMVGQDRIEYYLTPGASGDVNIVNELYDYLGNN